MTVHTPELGPPRPLAQPALERGQVKLEVEAFPPGGYSECFPETQILFTGQSLLDFDLGKCLNLLISPGTPTLPIKRGLTLSPFKLPRFICLWSD